jgi:hypothetical protein
MIEKLEGTIALDGLVEGRGVDDPAVALKLRQWVDAITKLGLEFDLSTAGNSFSLLPETRPVHSLALGDDPSEALRQMLDQLLELLPEEDRGFTSSTLRSIHFRPKEEVQSVYLLDGDSKFRIESRALDAETIAPPEPISTKERVRIAVFGLFLALAVMGIASLFIDFRGLVAELWGSVTPVAAEEIEVDNATFVDFIRVEEKTVNNRRGVLVLKLVRTDQFPLVPADFEKAWEQATSLRKRLVVEAIEKGYVRLELFDKKNQFIRQQLLRIDDLRQKETFELAIPLRVGSKGHRISRIRLSI